MANADVRATLFHDHARAHGAATPSAPGPDVGALSPAAGEHEEERVCLEHFWIDLGGEG